MISACLAVLLAQGQAGPSAGEVFSRMLAKYHEAQSLRGTVEFNQTAAGSGVDVKASILTTVQVAKPNLFFLEQTRRPPSTDPGVANRFLAVCDGKEMGYPSPRGLPWTDATSGKHDRLYEQAPQTPAGGLDAFCTMLLDRSLPVAVALYNPYEIELVTNRLSGLVLDGEVALDGEPAYRIKASYTYVYAKPNQPAIKIPAYVYIDKAYNLRGLVWEETLSDGGRTLKVTSQWIVRLQVNAKPDASLFRVR